MIFMLSAWRVRLGLVALIVNLPHIIYSLHGISVALKHWFLSDDLHEPDMEAIFKEMFR